jgi:hypothetical protein
MTTTQKISSIMLILALATLSMTSAQSTSASVPKPSVPQFTTEFVPGPLDIHFYSQLGSDDNTLCNIGAIKLVITNQQYSYSNGSTFSIYYNVRVRGHNVQDDYSWSEYFNPLLRAQPGAGYMIGDYRGYIDYIWGENDPSLKQANPQTNSRYTVIYLPVLEPGDIGNPYARGYFRTDSCPANSQWDFQVEAMLGVNSSYCYTHDRGDGFEADLPAVAYVVSSDWSVTQTVTIGDYSIPATPESTQFPTQSPFSPTIITQPTQTPTITPQNSQHSQTDFFKGLNWEQTAIIALVVTVTVLAMGMVVMWRKLSRK